MEELRDVLLMYEDAGFPGCLGCIDCMHIHRKTAQKQLKGSITIPKTGSWLKSLAKLL